MSRQPPSPDPLRAHSSPNAYFYEYPQLAERLRGSSVATHTPVVLAAGRLAAAPTAAGTEGSRRRSGDASCVTNTGVSNQAEDGVLAGIESGNPVQGPQCSVCHQYCFLVLAVCDSCDGGGGSMIGRRQSRAAGQRRRFVCGRHVEDLCACSASEYTFYTRRDAADLRAAAKGVSTLQERVEVWADEASGVLDFAYGRGEVEEDADGTGDVKMEEESGPGDRAEKPAFGVLLPSSYHVSKTERGDKATTPAFSASQQQMPRRQASSHAVHHQSSLLPQHWHKRPTVRYLNDLVAVGEELGGSEGLLTDLRLLIESCSRWTRAAESLLGQRRSFDPPVSEDVIAADREEIADPSVSGSAGYSSATRANDRERAFHRAAVLVAREAELLVRPEEQTERLCAAVLTACDLRLQVRLILGLGEDEVCVWFVSHIHTSAFSCVHVR